MRTVIINSNYQFLISTLVDTEIIYAGVFVYYNCRSYIHIVSTFICEQTINYYFKFILESV